MGTKLLVPNADFYDNRIRIDMQLLLKENGSYTDTHGNTYHAGNNDEWLEFDEIIPASGATDIKAAVLDIPFSQNLNSMFKNYTALESVVVNGVVSTISQMFSGCAELKEINFGNATSADIVNFSFAFSGCNKLTNIDLTGLNSSTAPELYDTFTNCRNVESITVPNWRNTLTSCHNAFANCEKCKHIDVSGLDFTGITKAADGHHSLTFGNTPLLETIKCKDSANAAWIQEVYNLAYAGSVTYSYDSSTHILTITRT